VLVLLGILAVRTGHRRRPAEHRRHLADDLGNADLGYRGSDIRTPNIDKLAKEGVQLESFHGMPVCTPARAALMTGRYPMRYGLQTLVIFPNHSYGLPTDERTLPQALKEAGYRTLMVGKWHLGHADRKFWPNNRGFEHFYGNTVGEVDYSHPSAQASPTGSATASFSRKTATTPT
jgi:arylsulfatase A-like enzyme